MKKEKDNLNKTNQKLEKENKSLKCSRMNSVIQFENDKMERQGLSLTESNIFIEEKPKNNNKNKSMNAEISLKGSIMPFGNFDQIPEAENEGSNSNSKKESLLQNQDNELLCLGNQYMEGDKAYNDDKNGIEIHKSSALSMSLNPDAFGFFNFGQKEKEEFNFNEINYEDNKEKKEEEKNPYNDKTNEEKKEN